MREFDLFRRQNWIRLGIGGPFALTGAAVFIHACRIGALLELPVALALIGIGTLFGAPLLAELFSEFFLAGLKGLIHPEAQYDRVPLRTSQAEALDKAGRFQEALDAYAALIREYPEEVTPVIARIRIAVERLHDAELAARFYEEGMTTLTSPRRRRTLTEMHAALLSQLQAPSLRERCHSLPAPRPRRPV